MGELTEAELRVCRLMDVTPEDYARAKKNVNRLSEEDLKAGAKVVEAKLVAGLAAYFESLSQGSTDNESGTG